MPELTVQHLADKLEAVRQNALALKKALDAHNADIALMEQQRTNLEGSIKRFDGMADMLAHLIAEQQPAPEAGGTEAPASEPAPEAGPVTEDPAPDLVVTHDGDLVPAPDESPPALELHPDLIPAPATEA
jgi:hypothetical protein